MRRLEVDHRLFSFFRRWENWDVQCLIVIHVDDGMGESNCLQFLEWVKKEILCKFSLKDLRDITQFLGVQLK